MLKNISMFVGVILAGIAVLGLCYLSWKLDMFLIQYKFKIAMTMGAILIGGTAIWVLFDKK